MFKKKKQFEIMPSFFLPSLSVISFKGFIMLICFYFNSLRFCLVALRRYDVISCFHPDNNPSINQNILFILIFSFINDVLIISLHKHCKI